MPLEMDREGREPRALLQAAPIQGARVVEIGCGDGRSALRYADAAAVVVAVEPDRDRLARALQCRPHQLREKLIFVASGAEHLPLRDRAFDVAELHAPFSHQELLLRETLGLSDGVDINPSGGALAADPIMATGLIRIGEAASHIIDGSAGRVLGHATSGPWLQQNLVCALEAG